MVRSKPKQIYPFFFLAGKVSFNLIKNLVSSALAKFIRNLKSIFDDCFVDDSSNWNSEILRFNKFHKKASNYYL